MSKVYEIITDRIIEQLEKGVIPWQQSWSAQGLPRNGISGKVYNGINPFLLLSAGYVNPYWFTFKQVQEAGGHVKKGEKSTMVVFWKKYTSEATNDEEEPAEHLVLRYYNVFNYDQCEGLNAEKYGLKNVINFNPIEAAESIVKGYKDAPAIESKEQRAYYNPAGDYINMPRRETFKSEVAYYKTLFHELTHSTGHEKRLNRVLKGYAENNRTDYSKEELIAEMGASFLSGRAGIFEAQQLNDTVAYIQGWLKALRNDTQLVIKAASAAQKAADFITAV
jgi:antirestriction protein ArdC